MVLWRGADEAASIAQDAASAGRSNDAFAYDDADRAGFERRAALGTSGVIYQLSPGGVEATAERTAEWRDEIEQSAAEHGVDPDRLEAVVFLESAGRPDVTAGPTPEAASGIAQIIPSTATDLLGMEVDLDKSIKLTKRIARAEADGDSGKARKLRRERAEVDERFDPEKALDGAARYLAIAEERFGVTDLATVSYHMGIGNLESVLDAYGEGEVPYAQVFFDTAPDQNPGAYEILSEFADDSSLYLWRVLASQEIMRMWREDPDTLQREIELATNKATLEELYHPADETVIFPGPDAVRRATEDGDLLPLPAGEDADGLGWKIDEQMGELAPRLDQQPELYRALRPEALAVLSYIGGRVTELSGAERPLRVTSSVRDQAYQDLLAGSNPEATQAYSLHTTGFAFDILRDYQNDEQAEAFQFVLDRLRALAVIDYAVEPRAIHVTVSQLGAELLDP